MYLLVFTINYYNSFYLESCLVVSEDVATTVRLGHPCFILVRSSANHAKHTSKYTPRRNVFLSTKRLNTFAITLDKI